MFLEFFYYLRSCGMQVSTQKWLDLMQALKLWLHGSTMKGWLEHPTVLSENIKSQEAVPDLIRNFDQEEIEKRLREQLEKQKEEHNSGYRYVGAAGVSPQQLEEKLPFAGILLKKDNDLKMISENW